jgi:hypothetical protein
LLKDVLTVVGKFGDETSVDLIIKIGAAYDNRDENDEKIADDNFFDNAHEAHTPVVPKPNTKSL